MNLNTYFLGKKKDRILYAALMLGTLKYCRWVFQHLASNQRVKYFLYQNLSISTAVLGTLLAERCTVLHLYIGIPNEQVRVTI